ncbi:hypothetical protein [Nocardia sp. NPDC056100]|uniref:hypothetical protein n=1 Tax=Nocardia sp. NPDC056100 TaxID=3345712 RepID=UPI0035E34C80
MALYRIHSEVPADDAVKTWDNTTDPRTLVSAVFTFRVPVDTELFDSGLGGLLGVTEPLAAALAATDLTGYRLVPATGEPSAYAAGASSWDIPTLYVLDVFGTPNVDDFAIRRGLVVSERAADFLCKRDPAFAERAVGGRPGR